ncbi:MAG: MoaD/ThiS family protein [Planctomycetota bacterium]|jgi:sulfur carrier protein ThiS
MRVQVRLFATLRQGRFSKQWIEFPKGNSVADMLRSLNIPEEDVGILLCDGRDAALDAALKNDAVISVFPALGGG